MSKPTPPTDAEGHERRRKLAAIREAARHSAPAPHFDQMLDEIEGGYLSVELD